MLGSTCLVARSMSLFWGPSLSSGGDRPSPRSLKMTDSVSLPLALPTSACSSSSTSRTLVSGLVSSYRVIFLAAFLVVVTIRPFMFLL